ncbi:hypothetical protein ACFXPS_41815 [Nocardia sp. NPDC059091]|uniref:hypothetical protein n=1 Tax=unclassified Nocardia TaxID=2637762 RepID=UPI00369C5686
MANAAHCDHHSPFEIFFEMAPPTAVAGKMTNLAILRAPNENVERELGDEQGNRRAALVAQDDSSAPAVMGHLGAAVSGLITIALLFQPWLSASGPTGSVKSDAFGRIEGVSGRRINWATGGYYETDIGGTWAVLAVLASAVTVAAVVIYLRTRSSTLSYLVVVSAVATAIFVLADLLYLSGKAPDLRAMTEDSRPVHGLSGLIQQFLGNDRPDSGSRKVASAGLDQAALLSGASAVAGAVAAVASGMPRHAWRAILLFLTAPQSDQGRQHNISLLRS